MVSPLPTPRLGLGPQASPSQLEEESGVPGIEGLTPGRVEPGLPESQGRPGRGRREHLLSWASPSCGCKAWADRGPGACPLRSPARCPRPWEMRQAPEGGESPPWLSPSLTGVRAHSSSWGLQDADARRGPWIKMGLIQYANNPRVVFNLNTFKSKDEMIKATSQTFQYGGDLTNTFKAIQYAR